jgi:hypothetical protein
MQGLLLRGLPSLLLSMLLVSEIYVLVVMFSYFGTYIRIMIHALVQC